MENTANRDCGKFGCSFFVKGIAECIPGGGSCEPANLLEAGPSAFHDQNLIEATRQIKKIIAGIPADPKGRTLSLLHTKMGTLLAWTKHGAAFLPEGAVTAQHDDATVAKALKLKSYAAASGR